ncbi:MAG TPA: cytochrome c biogenesis protein ResB [Egibacteraceae bacterium]|nr:cytochrome c biogenesis protein ResB [Egibacteraceae bacterium]
MTETVTPASQQREDPPSGGRLPAIPGPIETARRLWRALRRMSTALLLLFALAAAAVVATVVPQAPVTAQSVEQWRTGEAGPGPTAASVIDALGLFDVFGSWWFGLLVVLLFVSLTGCLVPRYRAFLRVARRPPAPGRNLGRLSNTRTFATDVPPAEVLGAAQRVLGRRRFRVRCIDADGAQQVAAERGHLREGGSLVFHTAFYVLLAGAIIGKVYGFTGQVSLPEGGSFADTRIAYDAADAGRGWELDDHRGFVVTLDEFDVSYFDDLTPREFVSRVTISEQGAPVRTADIRVNHPLRHDGMVLYQLAFGMAPHVVVRAGDRVLYDDRVLLSPNDDQNLWSGTAKVKFDDPERQIALDLVLAPDARLDSEGQPTIGPDPRPNNPVLIGNVYFGALGLQRPIPASQFERGSGPVDTAMLRPGGNAALVEGNLSVEFVDLAYWSGLQVSHAPGRLLLLLGAGLILAGLLPSLYSYRRRVWVDVQPEGTGSRVTVAGVALQRKGVFTDEFDDIATAVDREVRS